MRLINFKLGLFVFKFDYINPILKLNNLILKWTNHKLKLKMAAEKYIFKTHQVSLWLTLFIHKNEKDS